MAVKLNLSLVRVRQREKREIVFYLYRDYRLCPNGKKISEWQCSPSAWHFFFLLRGKFIIIMNWIFSFHLFLCNWQPVIASPDRPTDNIYRIIRSFVTHRFLVLLLDRVSPILFHTVGRKKENILSSSSGVGRSGNIRVRVTHNYVCMYVQVPHTFILLKVTSMYICKVHPLVLYSITYVEWHQEIQSISSHPLLTLFLFYRLFSLSSLFFPSANHQLVRSFTWWNTIHAPSRARVGSALALHIALFRVSFCICDSCTCLSAFCMAKT